MSASSQIARRLSPSAMRLQIASPSSVLNNDGRPIGRFGGFMGLDQFDRGAHLALYYASRPCSARVRPDPGQIGIPAPSFGSVRPNARAKPRAATGSGWCAAAARSWHAPPRRGFQAAKIGKHFVWHWLARTLRREMPSGISAFGNDVDIRTAAYMPGIAGNARGSGHLLYAATRSGVIASETAKELAASAAAASKRCG
jgi:hypothetical protein